MSGNTPWDNRYRVHTPEGVALLLQPASLLPRALAWVIDLVIRVLLGIVLALLLAFLGKAGFGLIMMAVFLLTWAYPVVCEGRWGTSPGKWLLGLRVVAGNGAPLGWGAATTRNLLRVVDLLPMGYATGALCSLFDGRSRRLGDLVADTLVIHKPRAAAPPQPSDVPAQPLPVVLDAEEQTLLLAFAERSRQLGSARSDELARLVPQLSQGGRHGPTVQLQALANTLLGRP